MSTQIAVRSIHAPLIGYLLAFGCSSTPSSVPGGAIAGSPGIAAGTAGSIGIGAAGRADTAAGAGNVAGAGQAGAPEAAGASSGGVGGMPSTPSAGTAGQAGATSFAGASSGSAGSAGSSAGASSLLASDSFTAGLGQWSVELESGGTVQAENGVLNVDVPAGATVWFKQQFSGSLAIEFQATAIAAGGANDHVTDLNMFWNARDTRSPNDLFASKRSGAFADYDLLTLYYVGYGANLDTTTRMRRYVGEAGNRPLLFDYTEPLLIANHLYRVKLVAAGSKVQYWSDGSLLFDYSDPKPYTSGWFAFRTTASHFHFAAFSVSRLP